MVPTVIEFDSEGSDTHVTEQARRIAAGMGRAESLCNEGTYEPKMMEVKCVGGSAPPEEVNLAFAPITA